MSLESQHALIVHVQDPFLGMSNTSVLRWNALILPGGILSIQGCVLFRLPIWHDVCDDAVLWKKALADIVKTRDGSQRTPLMRGIGGASFVNDITEEELLQAVADLKAQAETHPVSFMHMAVDKAPGTIVIEPAQLEVASMPESVKGTALMV